MDTSMLIKNKKNLSYSREKMEKKNRKKMWISKILNQRTSEMYHRLGELSNQYVLIR